MKRGFGAKGGWEARSPLYCKSFSASSWLQPVQNLSIIWWVFCISSHTSWFPKVRYANCSTIIVYPQTTFPQMLGPWFQLSTVNIKRGLVCAARQLNIQAGLTLMAPPSTPEIIFSFLLLHSGHEVESARVPGLALASRHQTTSTSSAVMQKRHPLCSWNLNPPLVFGGSLMWHVTMHLNIHIPTLHSFYGLFPPVSWQKACMAWWQWPRQRCRYDTVTYFRKNYV